MTTSEPAPPWDAVASAPLAYAPVADVVTQPKRIQRQRVKGWRMPKGAVYVGRPTQYGNPFVPDRDLDVATSVRYFRDNLLAPENADRLARMVRDLRGRDLMCWCPLDSPCHADVLLDLANAGGAS